MVMPSCPGCGVMLKDPRSKNCRSCSKKGTNNPMYGVWSQDHPNWQGGHVKKNGYRLVMRHGRQVYEHRWVMEQHLGRELETKEVIHHINHNKIDNRLENLQLITQAQHVNIHKPMLGKKSKIKRDPKTQRFISGTS